ncbi:hypothetical protein [Leptospira sp. GIMC2001]|uniref:hypothetical protein n=1 Tax=Leptospira sp. GIMC2001 TaxID=1513297 RepID=UPI00234B0FA9|nr:hypothetical protein [Leptospira sp. GIMC2001]WCL51173.1 hypothetical protein O4O04_10285 [Leptospira sp. GIMC2001]
MLSQKFQDWFKRPILVSTKLNFLNKKLAIYLGAVAVLCISLWIGYRILAYKAFESRIQVGQIRTFLTHIINTDLDKAVDVGIIEFSLFEGILVEDLVISQEEDFTFNRKLLQSRKIALQLSSIFSKEPYLKKIKIIDAKFQIDINDDFFQKLIDYLLLVNIQEVEFQGTTIELYEGERLILKLDEPTNWVFQKKNNTIELYFKNRTYFLPFITKIEGSGVIELSESKDYQLNFNALWRNIESNQLPGISLWLGDFDPDAGKMHGEMQIQLKDAIWNLNASSEWVNASGRFRIWEDLQIDNFTFKTKSIIQINNTSKIKSMQRNLLSEEVEWNTKLETKLDLTEGNTNWTIYDLESFSNNHMKGNQMNIGGSINGNLTWKETGIRNNWFHFNGEMNWNNGFLKEGSIDLNWNSWKTTIKENILNSGFDGEIFGSKLKLESAIKLQIWKSIRPDKTNYYPLGTNGEISGNLERIVLEHWYPIFNQYKTKIEKEIRERQEKIIPEEYFTQFKIYKYLLEEMNISWDLKINEIVTIPVNTNSKEPDNSILDFILRKSPIDKTPLEKYNDLEKKTSKESLKNWLFTGSIKSGRGIGKLVQLSTSNRLEFNTQFANKTPYLEFSINVEDIPWRQTSIQICGLPLHSDRLSLYYSIKTRGSDYYGLSKQANHSSVWGFHKAKFLIGSNDGTFESKLPIDRKYLTMNFDLDLEMDRYFETSYYRNIHWVELSPEPVYEWKGSGNSRSLYPSYNLYGKLESETKTLNFSDEGMQCR